jgi:hypothetical protein
VVIETENAHTFGDRNLSSLEFLEHAKKQFVVTGDDRRRRERQSEQAVAGT